VAPTRTRVAPASAAIRLRFGDPLLDRTIATIRNEPAPRRQVLFILAGVPKPARFAAASALARDLATSLYAVDLSAVVSKYIGETEKNLAALFDEAGRTGLALFFDEADPLFGKRSQVKDAHDRYANINMSDLLQRIEAFRGIMIAATAASGIAPLARRVRQIIVHWPPVGR
jgi:SpoVK/Ycf46/Vps4 family AAA+-type ATPase